jgi:hypothetical protein
MTILATTFPDTAKSVRSSPGNSTDEMTDQHKKQGGFKLDQSFPQLVSYGFGRYLKFVSDGIAGELIFVAHLENDPLLLRHLVDHGPI